MEQSFSSAWLSPTGTLQRELSSSSGLSGKTLMIVLDTASYQYPEQDKRLVTQAEQDSILHNLSERLQPFIDRMVPDVNSECMDLLYKVLEKQGFDALKFQLALDVHSTQLMYEAVRSASKAVMQQARATIKYVDVAAAQSVVSEGLLDGLQQMYELQMHSRVRDVFVAHMVGQMCNALLELGRGLQPPEPRLQRSEAAAKMYQRHAQLGSDMIACLFRLPRAIVVQLPQFWCQRLQQDAALRKECAASYASMLRANAQRQRLDMVRRFSIDHDIAWDLAMAGVVLCNPVKELMHACTAITACFPDNKWAAALCSAVGVCRQSNAGRGRAGGHASKSDNES